MLKDDVKSLDALAAGYARILTDVLACLEGDRIAAAGDPEATAALADWLLRHPQVLFRDKSVHEAAAALMEEEKKVAARIRAESRLAVAMLDGGPIDEHLFIRGVAADEGEVVPRRFL